jgi:cyclopropane-fatty-acyl-phospholipid synthase
LTEQIAIKLAESGLVPDSAIRAGIRWACENRLRTERAKFESDENALARFVEELGQAPIAEATDDANAQHYELPPEFFQLVLGPKLKYSGCDWRTGDTLPRAEERSLEIVCERARLANGLRILELGCGWGSLSLFMAARYPSSRITSISNSSLQREHIKAEAASRGLTNLQVITADINDFTPDETFDRIVTVEMLEHVRNYHSLFARIATWLKQDGRLFVHIFRHKTYPYRFETKGAGNWMGRHFFTGGLMPSHDLFSLAQDSLSIEESWLVNGTNYEKTANAWLSNLDARRDEALQILASHYGEKHAQVWLQRWRIFFMSCAELFGMTDGNEWGVSHYRFKRP